MPAVLGVVRKRSLPLCGACIAAFRRALFLHGCAVQGMDRLAGVRLLRLGALCGSPLRAFSRGDAPQSGWRSGGHLHLLRDVSDRGIHSVPESRPGAGNGASGHAGQHGRCRGEPGSGLRFAALESRYWLSQQPHPCLPCHGFHPACGTRPRCMAGRREPVGTRRTGARTGIDGGSGRSRCISDLDLDIEGHVAGAAHRAADRLVRQAAAQRLQVSGTRWASMSLTPGRTPRNWASRRSTWRGRTKFSRT